ncbi:hypothetical protein WN943_000965 [Citrus x changshan-huyou]
MVLDVPTRWNLTFLVLRSALKFEKAFDRVKDEDGHYVNWFGADGGDENENEKYRVGPPMEDDWDNSLDDGDDVLLSYMVKPMISKFVKYWGDNLEKSSGISESGDSSSLDPFAQYKKMKASTQDGYNGQNEVAKNILAIPVSTIASELAFNIRGCILDSFRRSHNRANRGRN